MQGGGEHLTGRCWRSSLSRTVPCPAEQLLPFHRGVAGGTPQLCGPREGRAPRCSPLGAAGALHNRRVQAVPREGAAGFRAPGLAQRSWCPGRFQRRFSVRTRRFHRRSPGYGYWQTPSSLGQRRDRARSPTPAATAVGAPAPCSTPAPIPGWLRLPAAIPIPAPAL